MRRKALCLVLSRSSSPRSKVTCASQTALCLRMLVTHRGGWLFVVPSKGHAVFGDHHPTEDSICHSFSDHRQVCVKCGESFLSSQARSVTSVGSPCFGGGWWLHYVGASDRLPTRLDPIRVVVCLAVDYYCLLL